MQTKYQRKVYMHNTWKEREKYRVSDGLNQVAVLYGTERGVKVEATWRFFSSGCNLPFSSGFQVSICVHFWLGMREGCNIINRYSSIFHTRMASSCRWVLAPTDGRTDYLFSGLLFYILWSHLSSFGLFFRNAHLMVLLGSYYFVIVISIDRRFDVQRMGSVCALSSQPPSASKLIWTGTRASMEFFDPSTRHPTNFYAALAKFIFCNNICSFLCQHHGR